MKRYASYYVYVNFGIIRSAAEGSQIILSPNSWVRVKVSCAIQS